MTRRGGLRPEAVPRHAPATRPVPASRWASDALLRLAARLRHFNAEQVALRERWLRRHGLPAGH